VCTNGTRVFVHRAIKDKFIAGVVATAKKNLRLGDPLGASFQDRGFRCLIDAGRYGHQHGCSHQRIAARSVRMDAVSIACTHLLPVSRVLGFIDSGISQGATLLAGGKKADSLPAANAQGYFVPPTIFDNVTDSMKIAQEEVTVH
jgi:acyl-CoA reductase-like NAD-dependent aldehyde dehydrogenase